MGKARAPNNPARPEPKAILDAIERDDIDTVINKLTIRQRRFAEEYVTDYNSHAAALRAGYAVKYADKQGAAQLKHQGVQFYIQHLTQSYASKIISVSPEYVIQEITAVIGKPGVRDGDKLRALELLARHLGMFVERTEITGKDGGAIAVEQRKIEEEAQSFTDLMTQLKERAAKDKAALN